MQVFLVGGAVRDTLLHKPIKDKDFVVVGTTPQQMLEAGFIQVGADFPVFLHPNTHQEYALARTERKSGHGYKGFQIYADADVSLQDDLKRRDLTINAMAMQVNGLFDETLKDGNIIDPYGGLQDLKNKTLRHVSSAFCEDPLRVLRVARFYSRYYLDGFSIHSETLDMMKDLVKNDELSHLSDERIWQESDRATQQNSPHIYWQTLWDIGAIDKLSLAFSESWQHAPTRQLVFDALALSAKMNASITQRIALLLFSLQTQPKTQHNKKQELYDAQTLGKFNKIPKFHRQFAQQLVQNFSALTCIDSLSADELLELITTTQAHKDICKLQDLVSTSQIWQLAKSQNLLKNAVELVQQISINDIPPDILSNLKGAAIGQYLNQMRQEKIHDLLNP